MKGGRCDQAPSPAAGPRRRSRTLIVILTAAVLAAVVLCATGPAAPLDSAPLPGGPRTPAHETVRGAFHVHTTRSDGLRPRADVARAAARAGLEFVIFTDHGDATREPEPPAYVDGVLCIDGVEISTDTGHFIAVGMPASPYPLGGAAEAVAEDVARLGGFGIAAHPYSPRSELAWGDWSVPLDGVEWINADSEWRDESRGVLARAFLDYLWRPAGALASLLDRPASAIARWDQLTTARRMVALPGHDAHGGVGREEGSDGIRRLHMPSYESSFRTFSANVVLTHGLSGSAAQDADTLLGAIRSGRVFTVVDAVAGPGALEFYAEAGDAVALAGEELVVDSGPARFTVRASVPRNASAFLFRNGQPIVESPGGLLEHDDGVPGAYRVEIRVPGAPGEPPVPWLVSNPIYRVQRPMPVTRAAPAVTFAHAQSLQDGRWRAEVSPGSTAEVTRSASSVTMTYRLRTGGESSQFAALAADIDGVPRDTAGVVFRGRATRPMRVSVQLRLGREGDSRWRRSVYLSPEAGEVRIPIDRLDAVDGSAGRPQLGGVATLLFVVDLVNAAPGAEGSFTVSDVALGRSVAPPEPR